MANTKFEWKMVEVEGYELESSLTELSNSDYEIFTVQFTGKKWGVVARKYKKDDSARNCMGFRAPS